MNGVFVTFTESDKTDHFLDVVYSHYPAYRAGDVINLTWVTGEGFFRIDQFWHFVHCDNAGATGMVGMNVFVTRTNL